MAESRFIESREEAEVTVIDKTVRNKWSWKWTEKLVAGTILGEFIRKLPRAGLAYCLWCRCDVNYGSRGWKAIEQHCQKDKHREEKKTRETNFSLPGMNCVFSPATWRDLLPVLGVCPALFTPVL